MFAARLHPPLAGLLLCLFVLTGCGEPQPPSAAPEVRQEQEPAPRPEPAATPPPTAEPAATAGPVEPPAARPGIESLVLTPEDTPFNDAPAPGFGEVPNADWLAASPQLSARDKLLPDLFDESANQDRVNVEGELLLDGSQGTSGMLDGIGMKIEISTD